MTEILNCPVCENRNFTYFITCVDHTVSREPFHLSRCKNCGFVFTNPQPEKEKLGSYYLSEDYISHSGKAKSLIGSLYLFLRKRSLKWKLSLLPKPKGKILDYGCGTGEFLKSCQHAGWNISGVEPSAVARQKAEALTDKKIEEGFKEFNQEFDSITLWHVLEHVADLDATLSKLSTALKKDGQIFIAVPNHLSYDAVFYKQHWAGYDVPRHLWHFSQSTMQQALKKNGLTIVKTIPMKLDAFYVSMLSEKYRNKNNKLIQLIKAFYIGLLSNSKAKKKNEYSSLIYVAQK